MYCMCFSKSYIAYGFFSLFTISKFCFYFHVCEFIFCFTAQGISCFGNNVFPSLDYTHTHAHTRAHTHTYTVLLRVQSQKQSNYERYIRDLLQEFDMQLWEVIVHVRQGHSGTWDGPREDSLEFILASHYIQASKRWFPLSQI